jgi:MFS family permease
MAQVRVRGKLALAQHIVIVALFFASTAIFVLSEVTNGGLGFPFDDSWIFAQYARNLAEGHGFCFNIGEPSNGFTSFLWLLLVALGYKLTGGFVVPMKVMGVAFGLGSVLMAYAVILTLTSDERRALWGSALTALFPLLIVHSLAGMEGSLFVFTALLGLWAHLRRRDQPSQSWLWEGVLWGLAVWARPENLLLWLLTTVDKLRVCRQRGQNLLTALRWLVVQSIVVAGFLLPWVSLNWQITGTPYPCTYLAKVLPVRKVFYEYWGVGRGVIYALSVGLVYWLGYLVVLFPTFMAFLLWEALRQRSLLLPHRWLFAVALSFVGVQVVQFPFMPYIHWGYYGRYLLPTYLLAGHALLCSLPFRRWAWVLGLAGILVGGGVILPEYAARVKETHDLHIVFGQWLRQNTPIGSVVATHDIGAIGFFSQRRIFDTQGLIHVDIALQLPRLHRDAYAMLEAMKKRRVSYLAAHERFFLVAERPDLFEPLKCGWGWNLNGDIRFCIYRIRWERWSYESGR